MIKCNWRLWTQWKKWLTMFSSIRVHESDWTKSEMNINSKWYSVLSVVTNSNLCRKKPANYPTVTYPHLQWRVTVTLRFSNRDLSHSSETELRRRDAAASTVIVFVNQIGCTNKCLHSDRRIQTLSTYCQIIWNDSEVEIKNNINNKTSRSNPGSQYLRKGTDFI